MCIDIEGLTVSLVTRISVIIGDVLVLVVTWLKTAQAYKEARLLNIKAPLVTMLFRDGAIAQPICCNTLFTDSVMNRDNLLHVRH